MPERKEAETAGGWQYGRKTREEERERGAGAGVRLAKIEGANDVQRVESLTERTNRLAGKKYMKGHCKTTLCVAR